MRSRHIERAEIRPTPGQVSCELWDADLAEEPAGGGIDPDATRRGHPDVAALVAFHAVRHAGLQLGADAARKDAWIGERAAGINIENADQGLHGVVDVEHLLVGREAETVGLVE